MSERAGLAVKKYESKEKGPVTSGSKADLSQSMEINSPVEQVLHLQRTIGNRAVTRLIQSGVLQAKLSIGQPGDIYEQEAESVAEQIMQMSEEPLVNGHWSLARKEKDLVQARRNSDQSSDISSCVESHINSLKGSGRPLSQATRDNFEPRFGSDFSQVRVHTGSDAAAIAREINARAFTRGSEIFFGAGQYSPETSSGKHLLAHELTHVVQQKRENPSKANRVIQTQSNPETTNSTCEDTVFYIILDISWFVPNRYFRDGTEIEESEYDSGLEDTRARENSCEIKISREIEGVPVVTPEITVNLLYTRAPCCNSFAGIIGWDLLINQDQNERREEREESVTVGNCGGQPCCRIQKTVSINLSVSDYNIEGDVYVLGYTYSGSS